MRDSLRLRESDPKASARARRVNVADAIGVTVAMYRYWNPTMAIAGVMIWLGAMPEHLWSVETGRPTSEAPKGIGVNLGTILTFVAVPVVWWALCD